MKTFYSHHPEPEPPLEIAGPAARMAIGAIAIVSIVAAGFLMFGAQADLGVLQLAAGPMATASGSAIAPLVVAHNGGRTPAAAGARATPVDRPEDR